MTICMQSVRQNNSTGSSNSFFGRNAGNTNTTGDANSFVGSSAGFNNTGGSGNSFVGVNAGLSNTTAFVSSNVKVVPTELVMDGSANFAIAVAREAKVEGAKGPKAEPKPQPVAPKPGEPKPAASPAPNKPVGAESEPPK